MPFKLLIVNDSELVSTSLRQHITFATEVSVITEVCTRGKALINDKRSQAALVTCLCAHQTGSVWSATTTGVSS